VASISGLHFAITLGAAGAAYVAVTRARTKLAALVIGTLVVAAVAIRLLGPAGAPVEDASGPASQDATAVELLWTGLKGGALTFGGAYTAIPFVQDDAVNQSGWMTDEQFLDGVALSGILPAPLVIFATFVGFVSGGPLGAVAITVGMFLPAFAMTLLGHRQLERAVDNARLHAALDGITAGVVGLAIATTLGLAGTAVPSAVAAAIFGVALVALYTWKASIATPVVVLLAGLAGILLFGAA
jgi:chromate transporter